jgi:hypothetical protein
MNLKIGFITRYVHVTRHARKGQLPYCTVPRTTGT